MRLFVLLLMGVVCTLCVDSYSVLDLTQGTLTGSDGHHDSAKNFVYSLVYVKSIHNEIVVVLTLEESAFPTVTFVLSYKPTEASETVTLKRGEQRIVTLKMHRVYRYLQRYSFDDWFLTVTIDNQSEDFVVGDRDDSETEVLLQTDKTEYLDGETVFYRAIIVDQTQNASYRSSRHFEVGTDEHFGIPKVEVPHSGIVMGNTPFYPFTISNHKYARVSSTAYRDSEANRMRQVPPIKIQTEFDIKGKVRLAEELVSLRMILEKTEVTTTNQRKVKAFLQLTSFEGLPQEGQCEVTLRRTSDECHSNGSHWQAESKFEWRKNVSLSDDAPTGEVELEMVEELEDEDRSVEFSVVDVSAVCTHLLSGTKVNTSQQVRIYSSLFSFGLHVRGPAVDRGKATVIIAVDVFRKDGGAVEEADPKKGLQVDLLLSNDTSRRLQPLRTNFSLSIPKDGKVRLEFQVNDTSPFSTDDKVRVSLSNTVRLACLEKYSRSLSYSIDVSLVDPTTTIQKGDVIRVRIRSCHKFPALNTIISSEVNIYSSRRFSFSPPEEAAGLDEVIELTVPHNITHGSPNLLVYGLNYVVHEDSDSPHHLSLNSNLKYATSFKSINLNVDTGHQQMKVDSQFDAGMSTKVTLNFKRLLSNSVVSVVATKLSDYDLEERRGWLRPLTCHQDISPYDPITNQMHRTSSIGELAFAPRHTHRLKTQAVLFDVDKLNSTSSTFLLTKSFDRATQFGSYVFSAVIRDSQTGLNFISSSEVVSIPPLPVTYDLSVPPSILLGETVEIVATITNPSDTLFQGNFSLHNWQESVSLDVTHRFELIKPHSSRILKFPVTPVEIGDVTVSLRCLNCSDLTVTKSIKVKPHGVINKFSRSFLVRSQEMLANVNSTLETTSFELPPNCTPLRDPGKVFYEGDILGDTLSFVNSGFLEVSSRVPEFVLFRQLILLRLRHYYVKMNDAAAVENVSRVLKEVSNADISERPSNCSRTYYGWVCSREPEPLSVPMAANTALLQWEAFGTPYPLKLNNQFASYHILNPMQKEDGSFEYDGRFYAWAFGEGVVANTALALRSFNKWRDVMNWDATSKINVDLKFQRGVEFLRSAVSSGNLNSNFEVAAVALFFSEIQEPAPPDLLGILQRRSSSDSQGTFWASTATVNTTTFTSSVAATSFALLAHVNLNQLEEATPIASWLISQKNADGLYGNLHDTAAAVESLAAYGLRMSSNKRSRPSLMKKTLECVTAPKDISNYFDNLDVSVKEESGSLSIKICVFSSTQFFVHSVEVSLPSGYLLQYDTGNPGWPTLKGHGHSLETSRREKAKYLFRFEGSLGLDCFNLTGLRMFNVTSSLAEAPLVGSVTSYDPRDPPNKSTKFFYLPLTNEVHTIQINDILSPSSPDNQFEGIVGDVTWTPTASAVNIKTGTPPTSTEFPLFKAHTVVEELEMNSGTIEFDGRESFNISNKLWIIRASKGEVLDVKCSLMENELGPNANLIVWDELHSQELNYSSNSSKQDWRSERSFSGVNLFLVTLTMRVPNFEAISESPRFKLRFDISRRKGEQEHSTEVILTKGAYFLPNYSSNHDNNPIDSVFYSVIALSSGKPYRLILNYLDDSGSPIHCDQDKFQLYYLGERESGNSSLIIASHFEQINSNEFSGCGRHGNISEVIELSSVAVVKYTPGIASSETGRIGLRLEIEDFD